MIVSVVEPFTAASLAKLHASGLEVRPLLSEEAEVLLIRSRTQVDAELLNSVPKLKLVVTATSGFDHIDWRECVERKITATHTPSANAMSTAELTMSLILAWERNLLGSHKSVKTGKWREGLSRPAGLEGKTLGLIGLGRVGTMVARMASAFGLRLQAYDPYIDETVFLNSGCQRIGLIELLKTSDIVSLHVPLTKETRHLLNQPTFNEMQSDALLVNTCRGPVVDENALLTALDEGTIAGAACDVIEREPPPPGHRVLTHPKLLLTPHIGAFTDRAWEKASMEAVEKVLRFHQRQPIEDVLPLQTAWWSQA